MDTGYQIAIKPNHWELSQLSDGIIIEQGNLSTSPADRSTNHLLLIVKDSYAILYINDEFVFEQSDLERDRIPEANRGHRPCSKYWGIRLL